MIQQLYKLLLRLPIFGLAMTCASVFGVDEGKIEGRIYLPNGEPSAAGTLVTISQINKSTKAAPDGTYAFPEVPAGTYDLVFTDAQGREAKKTISVTPNRTIDLNARLDDSVVVLGKMQVTADSLPPDVARAAQQQAPNFVNIITAYEMRKLPDVNAAEAVRRLPGIALETDTGEGRYINIRGLDADLNSTTFGGVRLPPTNIATPLGGGRAVAMDAIPAGVVSSITVTKTNRPDQDAEALGGTIEITPKIIPANGRPFVEGRIGTGLERLRKTGIFEGELTAGGRFGPATAGAEISDRKRPFSLLASISRYYDGRGIDDNEPGFQDAQDAGVPDLAYNSIDQRYYQYHRHRYGYAAQLGYQPDDNNSWYIRYNEFGYTEYVTRQRLILDNLDNADAVTDSAGNVLPAYQLDPAKPNAIIAPAAEYKKALRDDEEHTRSRVAVFGGENKLDNFTATYHLSFSEGSFHKPHDYNATFKHPTPGAIEYDNATDLNYPVYNVLSGPNPADPSGYVLSSFYNGKEDDRDSEWGGALNVSVPTDWLKSPGEKIVFGGSLRLRDRTLNVNTWNSASVPAIPLSSVLVGPADVVFYRNNFHNGPNIDNLALRNLFATDARFVEDANADLVNNLTGHEKDTENVYAGYSEYEFTLGNASVLAGARLEHTHSVYRANQVSTDNDGNLIGYAPISQSVNYNDVFPTIQLKYQFRPGLEGRIAYSTAIARPGFNQVTAATSINPGADTVQEGNPDLKPTTGQNFDAAIERYLPHGGIASIGVFDKEFSNYIANRVENGVTFPNNGLFAGFSGAARVITFLNLSGAYARGFELNYQEQFTQLPGVWGGFGVSANYSYVDSSAEIRPGEKSVLPSTSKNIYNASAFYDHAGLNISLAASFIGKNIFGIGDSAATDTWVQDRFNLDLGTSYAINQRFTYYLNFKNLANTALRFTEGSADRHIIQREFYGITVQSGVSFIF